MPRLPWPSRHLHGDLVIDSASGLVDTGAVVPGQPLNSNLYARLITTDNTKRMPLGQPALDNASLQVISDWIAGGAPDWNTTRRDIHIDRCHAHHNATTHPDTQLL